MFFLADPIELISMHCCRWPFTLQLKDHDAIVMTCRKEVDFRMCSDHPTEVVSVLKLLVTSLIGDWATHKRSFSLLKLYFGSVYTELGA